MSKSPKPVVLIIMDGWGYSESPDYNAIYCAHTPFWDRLWGDYPHALIHTSGAAVGLPGGQMGNSEVGHINLGAGRVVYQEATRIERSVRTGSFYDNATLTAPLDKAAQAGKAVHIMGLLSDGGVHSVDTHLHAMVRLAARRGVQQIHVHAFTDGRDTPPRSAMQPIKRLQCVFDELGKGRLASITGRYFAMDRDSRWERIKVAYDLIFHGVCAHVCATPEEAIDSAYARDEGDEFIDATAIAPEGGQPVRVAAGDVLFFMNFRADRARQLARAICDEGFDAFDRGSRVQPGGFVSLTQYSAALDIPMAFPPEPLENVLGRYIADKGLRQLRLAETEKYAHVTFFFNGGTEDMFEGEERIMVPSPEVSTYDLKPEMSAAQVTDHLVDAIRGRHYDLIICNYANTDMVGHSGNQDAAERAVVTVDGCLERVVGALEAVGGEALITADHGNAELLFDEKTGQAHTAHTTNPVPLVYVGRDAEMLPDGALADISPTLLLLMGLAQPVEMTGRPLVRFCGE